MITGLYQKFGFWPRFLTPVMTKIPVARRASAHAIRYTQLPAAERIRALDACRELTASACEGLDLQSEIHAVESQGLGDRAAILGEHRTVLAVFAAALVAGLVCAVALPGRSADREPARVPGGS